MRHTVLLLLTVFAVSAAAPCPAAGNPAGPADTQVLNHGPYLDPEG
jgi:hypothetical protein